MKQEKEQIIVSSRIWLDSEIGELAGFAHEQFGYKGIKYALKELKRISKVIKRELNKK